MKLRMYFLGLRCLIVEMGMLNKMVKALVLYSSWQISCHFVSKDLQEIVLLCICPSTLLKYGLLRSGFIWHERIDIKWSLLSLVKRRSMSWHILICWLTPRNSLYSLCRKKAIIIYDIFTITIQKFGDFFSLKCSPSDFKSEHSLYAATNANSCSLLMATETHLLRFPLCSWYFLNAHIYVYTHFPCTTLEKIS